MIRHHMYVLAVPDLERSAAFMPVADTGFHSYFAYLEVDDADAWHARALAAGAEMVKALADEAWGMREFGVRTADGHRIMIGHELPGA